MDTWTDQNAVDPSTPDHLQLLDTDVDQLREQSPIAQCLLERDLDDLAEELARDDRSQALSRSWAALELRRRIGGPSNLRAYLKCLITQARGKLRCGQWQAPVPPGPTVAWGEDAWIRYICLSGKWHAADYRTNDAYQVYAHGDGPDAGEEV